MNFVACHAVAPVAGSPAAGFSRPRPSTARRIRPRSPLPPPPRSENGCCSGGGRGTFPKASLERAGGGGGGEDGCVFPVRLGGVSIPASGISMPIALLLSLLAVSGGAAAAAAAAATASAAAQKSSSTLRLPFASPAFCLALLPGTDTGTSFRLGGGFRPPRSRRSRRRRSATAAPATFCSRGRSVRCCWSTGTPPPLPSSLWSSQRNGRSGGVSERRRSDGSGGKYGGNVRGRRSPLSRRRSKAKLGLTDDYGGGITGEASYRPEDGRGHRDCEWDDDMDLLSNFGFDGDSSNSYSDGGDAAAWGTGVAVTPSLSGREVARLEEVGIMVEELEGDSGAAAAPAAVVGTPADAASSPGAAAEDAARFKDLARVGRWTGFGGGATTVSARYRMARGDPVFFSHLAELIQGVHQQSGGRKFLTHAEEMELGAKVRRYRVLIEAQEQAEKESGCRPRLREVARSAGLSEEAFTFVMQDGMGARQKLVVCNLALVVSLSSKFKRNHFDCGCLQTLIQEGTIGLIRAAERFDPTKGFRFTTYAIWWIEARLRMSVQTEERMIHVPMWVKNQYNVVSRSVPKLRESLGRDPTPQEVAQQVALDTDSKVVVTPKRVEELKTWVAFHRKHESLQAPRQLLSPVPMDCSTIEHGVKATDPSTESTSELEIQRDFLESCLCHDLSKIQRKILRMKVGLGGEKGKNRKEISRALKMPFSYVISEERKAIYKLRGLQRGGGYPSFEELK